MPDDNQHTLESLDARLYAVESRLRELEPRLYRVEMRLHELERLLLAPIVPNDHQLELEAALARWGAAIAEKERKKPRE